MRFVKIKHIRYVDSLKFKGVETGLRGRTVECFGPLKVDMNQKYPDGPYRYTCLRCGSWLLR